MNKKFLVLIAILLMLSIITAFAACDGATGGGEEPEPETPETVIPDVEIELSARDQKNVTAGTFTIKYSIDNADELEEYGDVEVSFSVWNNFGTEVKCRNGKFEVEAGIKYYVTITATLVGDGFTITANKTFTVDGVAGDSTEYSYVSFASEVAGGVTPDKYPQQQIETGSRVTRPAVDPTLDGYVFDYWYKDNPEVEYDFKQAVTVRKMTLYAKWHTVDYRVSVVTDTEETEDYEVVTNVLSGYTLSAQDLPVPVKRGYDFAGWYYMADDEESEFVLSSADAEATVVTGDMTVTARWNRKHFALTLSSRGEALSEEQLGECAVDYLYEDRLAVSTLPVLEDTRAYRFAGWAYADGTVVDSGDTLIFDGDIALSAVWQQIEYTVTFECGATGVDGLTDTTKIVSIDSDDDIMLVTPPENFPTAIEGREFDGWYATGSDVAFDFANTEITSDMTITARWKGLPYIVSLRSVVGDEEPLEGSVETKIYNSQYTPAAEFESIERAGYIFRGWGVLADEELQPVEFPLIVKGDVELYAIWQIVVYTATLDYKDNLSENGAIYTDINADYHFANPTAPKRTGYIFSHWSLGEAREYADRFLFGEYVADSDITLVANWSLITFDVTFKDGRGNDANLVAKVRGSVEGTILPDDPTKVGYEFNEWKYIDGNAEIVTFDEKTEVLQDCTVFADWTILTYTVTFHLTEGTFDGENDSTTAEGTINGTDLPDVDVYGYDFVGWQTEDESEFSATTQVTAELDVYSVLTKKTFTVTVYANEKENSYFTCPVLYLDTLIIDDTLPEVQSVVQQVGYEFEGNYYSYVNDVKTAYDFAPVTANIKLYVDRKLITHTVTFNFTAGESEVQMSVLTDINTDNKVSADRVLRCMVESDYYKYTLTDWFYDEGKAHKIDDVYNIVIDTDKEYYVTAIPDTPHISVFVVKGMTDPALEDFGTPIDIDLTGIVHYDDDPEIMLPHLPELENNDMVAYDGYRILGWYLFNNVDEIAKIEDIDKIDQRFAGKYAYVFVRYELITYNVSFDSVGGSDVETQTISYLDDYKATEPADVTRDGYTLSYWFRKDQYGRQLEADVNGFDFDTVISADTVLYAKWNINEYVVTLNAAEGRVMVEDQPEYYTTVKGTILGVDALPVAVLEGYSFVGWFDSSDQQLTATTEIHSNVTYYARYEIIYYNVTFKYSANNEVVRTGSVNGVQFPDDPPEREGYEFRGWANSDVVLTSETDKILSDMTVTPNYVKIKYYINFVTIDDNGNVRTAGSAVSSIDNGYIIDQPLINQRAGSILDGWYEISGEYNTNTCVYESEFDFVQPIKRNVELYAKLRDAVTSRSGVSSSWIFRTRSYNYDKSIGEFVEAEGSGKYLEILGFNVDVMNTYYPDCTDVIIPSRIVSSDVFRIADGAFCPNDDAANNALLARIKTYTIEVKTIDIGSSSTVITIGSNAFANNKSLESLYFSGDLVVNFDESMLWNCTGLTNIYVDSSVIDEYRSLESSARYIDYIIQTGAMSNIWYTDGAVRYLLTAESATVKDTIDGPQASEVRLLASIRNKTVNKIGSFAFVNIGGTMISLTFGEEIREIAYGAFDSCTVLSSLYIDSLDIPAELDTGAFLNSNASLVVYVPQSEFYLYKADPAWSSQTLSTMIGE